MKSYRSSAVWAGLIVTGVLAISGLAWACSPQSQIYPLGVQSAQAHARIPVEGVASGKGGYVQIHWNGFGGPVVGSGVVPADQSRFSIEVTVPEASPGIHYLIMLAPDGTTARAAIEVEGPTGSGLSSAGSGKRTVSSDLWSGLMPSGSMGFPVSPAAAERPSSASPALAAGIAMSAFGLGAVAAALAAGGSRRKKVGTFSS